MSPRQIASRENGASRTMLRVIAVLLIMGGAALPRAAQARRHHAHQSAYHVVKAVNEAAQTVTVGTEHSKDHSEKALTVNGFTEITVNGIKASLHDLRPGMMVQVEEEADNVATALEAQHHNAH